MSMEIYQVINTGSLTDMYDLESVEVLRGPQGALLGKSSGAGAILLRRSRPTGEFGGRAQVEYGTKNLTNIQGLVNFPIVENILSGKMYANVRKRDPYVRNLAIPGADLSGEDSRSIRGALLYTPNDSLEVYLSADYKADRSDQQGGRNMSGPGTIICDAFQVCADGSSVSRNQTRANFVKSPKIDENNITADVVWTGNSISVKSLTGYRDFELMNNQDLDYLDGSYLEIFDAQQKVEQFSQEFRVMSEPGGGLDLDGRLVWLVAGYYGHSKADMNQGLRAFGAATHQAQKLIRDNYAIFGHFDYEIMNDLYVSAGVRRSWDKIDHDFSLALPQTTPPDTVYSHDTSFNNTSSEIGLKYHFDSNLMVYIRYSEGYRSGGFVGLPGSLEAATEYDPETSKSYEMGVKSSWYDGRFMTNLTVFETEFDDLQRIISRPGPGNTFIQVTDNAATAKTRGVEFESLLKITDSFSVGANIGYLDAKYTDYVTTNPDTGASVDLSDQPLTFSPKWTANIRADYRAEIKKANTFGFDSVDYFINFSWQDDYEMSNILHPIGLQKSYSIVDASVSLSGGGENRYSVTAYVDNLFDEEYLLWPGAVAGVLTFQTENIGRTVGVKLSFDF